MKISLYSWKIVDAYIMGQSVAFSTSPFDKACQRKEVEVDNVTALEIEMKKFAEELTHTGIPFQIGQRQVKGSRAFRGYKDFNERLHVNTTQLVADAWAKHAAGKV